MELKDIKEKVNQLKTNKDSKGAFKFYRKAIKHLTANVEIGNNNWDKYIEALHPLVELSKKGGSETNYGYGLKKPKPKKDKPKKKIKAEDNYISRKERKRNKRNRTELKGV